jgi:hypothetical protein
MSVKTSAVVKACGLATTMAGLIVVLAPSMQGTGRAGSGNLAADWVWGSILAVAGLVVAGEGLWLAHREHREHEFLITRLRVLAGGSIPVAVMNKLSNRELTYQANQLVVMDPGRAGKPSCAVCGKVISKSQNEQFRGICARCFYTRLATHDGGLAVVWAALAGGACLLAIATGLLPLVGGVLLAGITSAVYAIRCHRARSRAETGRLA